MMRRQFYLSVMVASLLCLSTQARADVSSQFQNRFDTAVGQGQRGVNNLLNDITGMRDGRQKDAAMQQFGEAYQKANEDLRLPGQEAARQARAEQQAREARERARNGEEEGGDGDNNQGGGNQGGNQGGGNNQGTSGGASFTDFSGLDIETDAFGRIIEIKEKETPPPPPPDPNAPPQPPEPQGPEEPGDIPELKDFDLDGDGQLTPADLDNWRKAYDEWMKKKEEWDKEQQKKEEDGEDGPGGDGQGGGPGGGGGEDGDGDGGDDDDDARRMFRLNCWYCKDMPLQHECQDGFIGGCTPDPCEGVRECWEWQETAVDGSKVMCHNCEEKDVDPCAKFQLTSDPNCENQCREGAAVCEEVRVDPDTGAVRGQSALRSDLKCYRCKDITKGCVESDMMNMDACSDYCHGVGTCVAGGTAPNGEQCYECHETLDDRNCYQIDKETYIGCQSTCQEDGGRCIADGRAPNGEMCWKCYNKKELEGCLQYGYMDINKCSDECHGVGECSPSLRAPNGETCYECVKADEKGCVESDLMTIRMCESYCMEGGGECIKGGTAPNGEQCWECKNETEGKDCASQDKFSKAQCDSYCKDIGECLPDGIAPNNEPCFYCKEITGYVQKCGQLDLGVGACPGACSQGEACETVTLADQTVCHRCSLAEEKDPCDGIQCPSDTDCKTYQCVKGECAATNKSGSCDDSDACTSADQCEEGECQGTAVSVPPDTVCMTYACDKTQGIQSTAKSGAVCDDGDKCTAPDTCNAEGACVGTPIEGCGDPCYNVQCPADTDCVTYQCVDGDCPPTNKQGSCDDQDACTSADQCSGGECRGTQVEVPSDELCATYRCDSSQGVVKEPKTGSSCDDGDVCTGQDTCKADGSCAGRPITGCAKTCQDADLKAGTCPGDCDPPSSCSPSDLPNGTKCHLCYATDIGGTCRSNDLYDGDCPGACSIGEKCVSQRVAGELCHDCQRDPCYYAQRKPGDCPGTCSNDTKCEPANIGGAKCHWCTPKKSDEKQCYYGYSPGSCDGHSCSYDERCLEIDGPCFVCRKWTCDPPLMDGSGCDACQAQGGKCWPIMTLATDAGNAPQCYRCDKPQSCEAYGELSACFECPPGTICIPGRTIQDPYTDQALRCVNCLRPTKIEIEYVIIVIETPYYRVVLGEDGADRFVPSSVMALAKSQGGKMANTLGEMKKITSLFGGLNAGIGPAGFVTSGNISMDQLSGILQSQLDKGGSFGAGCFDEVVEKADERAAQEGTPTSEDIQGTSKARKQDKDRREQEVFSKEQMKEADEAGTPAVNG
ncbi:MAG: hypothetical protein K8I00_07680, partial [Candidatus Omnitrophica bacterium]|nr:hypothetical protein [Candidatus Omnitrophota bacterium]